MAKTTQKIGKVQNKTLILKTIYQQDGLSRAVISRETGLTRPTVSALVTELIDEGLVREAGLGYSTGGKRPIILQIAAEARHTICVDLGNAIWRGARIDLRGRMVHQASRDIGQMKGGALVAILVSLIDELVAADEVPVLGMSIGTPGLVEPETGLIRWAANLDWLDLPLGERLRERYDWPIYLANDSQMGALAEYLFGAEKELNHLIVVRVGRGIGAGLVLNGRLFYGDQANAGEIGHIVVDEVGGHGITLEDRASGRAIRERVRLQAEKGHDVLWDEIGRLPVYESIVVQAGQALGGGLAPMLSLLDVRRLVISGEVLALGDAYLAAVAEGVGRFGPSRMAADTDIVFSTLGDDIVLLGCSALLLERELGVV